MRSPAWPLVLLLLAPALPARAQWQAQSSGATVDLRGLGVVNKNVVWAGGKGGTWLRTVDGGAHWTVGQVPGAEDLDFRGVQATDSRNAWLMSSGPGEKGQAQIHHTTDGGAHWTKQYDNRTPGAFLDALIMLDAREGIALGDPVDGQFLVLHTQDGGEHWTRATELPRALPGEGVFAASGTALAIRGGRAWFVTGGGGRARVFRSTDAGHTWKVTETQFDAKDTAGLYSIAFWSDREGMASGGDYKQPDARGVNLLRTKDGGETWTVAAEAPPPGLKEAVAFPRGTKGRVVVVAGPSGTATSTDGGLHWGAIETTGYHAIGFATAVDGWAVGAEGRVARFKPSPE